MWIITLFFDNRMCSHLNSCLLLRIVVGTAINVVIFNMIIVCIAILAMPTNVVSLITSTVLCVSLTEYIINLIIYETIVVISQLFLVLGMFIIDVLHFVVY